MAAGTLQFDHDQHVYTLDGVVVPGVTTILKPLSAAEYRFAPTEVMERARWRGQAAHRLIELDIKGTLDVDALDEQLLPVFASWRQFRAQSGFTPMLSECQVLSRRHGFAGTLDLFGTMNGEAALIDAKHTASVPKTAGPQTAAYEIGLRESRPEIVAAAACGPGAGRIHRFALHLIPGEGWRLVPFKDPNDARVFLSALTLHPWLERRAA